MISTFKAPGQFWRGNLHGHSNLSDGKHSLTTVCELYSRAGYDFTCVTDHFREKYGFPLADTRECRKDGFTTLIGAELHAPVTSRGLDWHILAVGLPLDFERGDATETGPELARRAATQGAFIAIAHPDWYQLQEQDGVALDAAHAVEIYNHTSHINTARGGGAAFYDNLLSAGHRLGCIAVDDSHWHEDDAFGAWVMVKAEYNEPEALLAALHAGNYYSSQGPTIFDVEQHNHMLRIEHSPASRVLLLGAGRCSAVAHGHNQVRTELPLNEFANDWCRLVIVDAAGHCAWTNPLWLS